MDRKKQPTPDVGQQEKRARHAESARASRVRQRRRKQKLRIFYALLFLIVLGFAVTLSLTVLFQINSIQVTGTSRYSQEEIVKASGIQTGENLFLTKTKQAEAEISQKLPYIGAVKVSRKLPAKISIQVEAATVDGAVETENGYVLLTGSGKMLELVEQPPENGTLIVGLALKSASPGKSVVYQDAVSQELYQQLIVSIKNNSFTPVTKIDISNPYRILIEYDKRIILNLGTSADLDYKIRFGKTILEGKNENGEDNIGKEEKGVLNLGSAKEDDRAYFDPNGVISNPAQSKAGSAQSAPASAVSSAA